MNVAVIGSGTMGSGIAQVAAAHGCTVKIYDASQEMLAKSRAALDKTMEMLLRKGKIDAIEKNRICSSISYVTGLGELSDAELVIEAVVENLDVKRKLFSELESLVLPETIMASNTSSLSIASIASACGKPDRVIGVHFFNPAPLMQLVEVIPAIQTSAETLGKAVAIISGWNKVVAVAKDTPGFIVNRVARPFYGEALRIYEEGLAGFETIDRAMKSIGGFRMGPFELMDFIGNDVNYTVTETVFTAFYFDPRYKPSFTQKRLVEAGYLGRKSGKGFFDYTNENPGHVNTDADAALLQDIADRIIAMLINEAADALFLNIASAKDIDNAMTKGVNYPKGLLSWADEKGIDWCVAQLDSLYDMYHEDRYRCSPLLRKMNAGGKTFF